MSIKLSIVNYCVNLAFLTCLLATFVVTSAIGFFIDEEQSPQNQHWTYGEQEHWSNQYRQCNKSFQSPIDIQHSYVRYNPRLKIRFFNYNTQLKFKIQNAHHTIKMSPSLQQADNSDLDDQGQDDHNMMTSDIGSADGESDIANSEKVKFGRDKPNGQYHHQSRLPIAHDSGPHYDNIATNIGTNNADVDDFLKKQQQLPYNGAPTIKLEWFDDGNSEFSLHDIHFHWAERKDNGSEHAIDGHRASMEMHLVHIKRGLEKSKIGFTSDSVAVIGILIDSYKKSNADFSPIVNILPRLNGTDKQFEVMYKSLDDLLPKSPKSLRPFYTYPGSLTTPPCLEVVNWIIMHERLYLNAKQMEMFRNLYMPRSSSHGSESGSNNQLAGLIMPNIRNLKPLNNRMILSSFRVGRDDEMGANDYGTTGVGSAGSSIIITATKQSSVLLWHLMQIAVILLIGKISCSSNFAHLDDEILLC